MKIKVGVIFGGSTVEHEISIISAVQAMGHLNQDKYEIVPIYVDKNKDWYTGKMLMDIAVYKDFNDLKKFAKQVALIKKGDNFYLQTLRLFKRNIAQIDIAFPIVHGNNAEDGTLAGYLDTIGIPYVGSKVLGAAMGQDKVITKQVMKSCNIPIVDYTWFYDTEYSNFESDIKKEVKKIGYPVVVKPASLGSSIGIMRANDEEELSEAVMEASKYDTKIVVEKAITNLIEVNCSVLGNYEYQELSAIEEVISSDDILSYSDKYIGSKTKGGTKSKMSGSKGMLMADRIIPARIDSKTEEEIKKISKETFKALNLSGLCRIDFLVDKETGKVYVNEPNTIPGSLSFYLWEPIGKKYPLLLDDMISLAIKEYKRKNQKTSTFDTNVLSNFDGIKGTKGLKGTKKF